MLIQGGEWSVPPATNVPIVDIEVTQSGYNRNSWRDLRFQTNGRSGAPCVRISNTDQNWCYANTFEDLNFELPEAGAMELRSCFGTMLRNIAIFDMTTATADMIYLGGGGLNCAKTTIENYTRPSGDMGVFLDINAIGHYAGSLLIDNPGGPPGARVRTSLVSRGGQWVNQ